MPQNNEGERGDRNDPWKPKPWFRDPWAQGLILGSCTGLSLFITIAVIPDRQRAAAQYEERTICLTWSTH